MPAILNWTTEAKLAQLLERGWAERSRRQEPDRVVVELHHQADRVVTFRSLPVDAPQSAALTLF